MHKTFRLVILAAIWSVAGPRPGSPAPGFNLPELRHDQSSLDLKSLQGKVVVVDFWASWCQPCRKTVPNLEKMRERHPGLVVLALSIDEDKQKALNFLKPGDKGIVFLHDAKRKTAEAYDLGGMPSAYLIDKQGNLVSRYDGYGEGDLKKLEAEVGKLMEDKP